MSFLVGSARQGTRKSGTAMSASTTQAELEIFCETCDPDIATASEVPLGANLAAGIAPEDPDARQYWLWDADPLEEEPCP